MGINKYTIEDVRKKFEERGYILLENEYKNTKIKMKYICQKHPEKGEQFITFGSINAGRGCMFCGRERTVMASIKPDLHYKKICENSGLIFVGVNRDRTEVSILYKCPHHLELGIQSRTSNKVKNSKGCIYCGDSRFYSKSRLLNILSSKFPNIELLEDYVDMKTNIKGRCIVHDIEINIVPNNIRRGSMPCPMCYRERLSEANLTSFQEIEKQVYKLSPHIRLIGYNKDDRKRMDCFCIKHKKQFARSIAHIRYQPCGCELCTKESMDRTYYNYRINFWETLKCELSDMEFLSPFNGIYNPITVRCKKHDFTFETTPKDLQRRLSCCPKGTRFVKELRVAEILDNWGIDYIPQFDPPSCYDKYPLIFDYYLPDYNMCIEYDGEQHFVPVTFGGQSLERAKDNLKYTQRHDAIKNQYCQDNNMALIRIPYWEFEDMEYYLFNSLIEHNVLEETIK